MNALQRQLYDLFEVEPEKLEPTSFNPPAYFEIEVGSMYERPALSAFVIVAIADLFGTKDVNVDGYDVSGCETCDYGSDYGHRIEVKNATKNVAEFEAWWKEKRGAK